MSLGQGGGSWTAAGPAPGSCLFHCSLTEASPRPAGSQLDASWEEPGGSTGQDTVRDVYPKSALTCLRTGKAWVFRSLAHLHFPCMVSAAGKSSKLGSEA